MTSLHRLHQSSVVKQTKAKQLRILQLSDSHLYANEQGALLGINTRQSFNAVIKDAMSHHSEQAFDLILMTGDLSQDYSAESYHILSDAIEQFKCPWFWIPGNHDENHLILSEIRGNYVDGNKQVLAEDWQLVLLDSSVHKKVHGKLADSELSFLRSCLSEHPNKYTLAITHHQPVNVGSKWLDNIGIRNAEDYWSVAKEFSQLRCMLWGHVHQDFSDEKDGVTLLATPSTCVQFKPKSDDFAAGEELPGYRIIELLNNGTIKSKVYRSKVEGFKVDYTINGY